MSRRLLCGPFCMALALLAGCETSPQSAPSWVSCDELPGYTSYVDTVAAHIGRGNEREFSRLGRGEQVTLALWLREDGSLERLRTRTGSSDEMRELGRRSALGAAPYPRPPPALHDCVVGRPTEIILFALGPPCDLDLADAYLEEIVERVLEPLSREDALLRPGRGRVVLRLSIDASGELKSAEVSRSDSEAAAEKVHLAAREVAPYPAPDPSFSECLPEPLVFLLMVPGYLP